MSTRVYNLLGQIVDLKGKSERSTQSLNEGGSWYFKQIATYTSGSPKTILAGNTDVLEIPQGDTGYEENKLFDLSYDYQNSKFLPTTVSDMYVAAIRGKVVPVSQAGHMDITIRSPGASFNPIDSTSVSFNKSGGVEQFFSPLFLVFIGPELVTNGIEVDAKANNTDMDIYDYSFTICRLFSNKGRNKE